LQWTKAGSWELANQWWQRKRATLEGAQGPALPPPLAPQPEGEAERLRAVLETLRGVYGDALDPNVVGALVGASKMVGLGTVPPERTVGHWAQRWLAIRLEEAQRGVRAPSGLRLLRSAVTHFEGFAGAGLSVDRLNADLWERWGCFCQGQVARRDEDPREGWAGGYASKVYQLVRTLMRWLWEQGAIQELPRNLGRRVRFDRPGAVIRTYSNLREGVITRRRHKTRRLKPSSGRSGS
jgi:hypothetical protein